jgi:hypothetical protein
MTISYFDVVRNPMERGRDVRPYYVCVQHSHLDHLRTRVMAPLIVTAGLTQQNRLNPILDIENAKLFLDPTDLVTMEVRRLGKAVANLASDSFRIITALDLVFTGV